MNGKIYKIWSSETDEIYVGSTVSPLHKRMYKHRHDATHGRTKMRIHQEMQRLGLDTFTIELIQHYPCTTCDELHMREGYWIRALKPSLNALIAGRTRKEWKDDNKDRLAVKARERWLSNRDIYLLKKKERYENNKVEILQKQKQYASEHIERISAYQRQYRKQNEQHIKEQKQQYAEKNKDKLKEISKNYREQNREKIQAQKSEAHLCTICGSTYTNCHKARHERTKKHLQALELQN